MGFFYRRDPNSGYAYDSLLTLDLSPANYTATLTQYENFSVGTLLAEGFQGSFSNNFDGRSSHWAVDILNVTTAATGASYISPIPEPESYALLLAGLGLVSLAARRRLGL